MNQENCDVNARPLMENNRNMKMESSKLITELQKLTKDAKSEVEKFTTYSIESLNYKASPAEWSILECCEHLCLYGSFYLPEIENQMIHSVTSDQKYFKSGWLGGYFVNMIRVSNTKKIKATKQMDSTGSQLDLSTLDRLSKQLDRLESLLNKARTVDLMRVKTSISLTRLLKLRLGDTLRFLVYHNERHILQAKRIETKGNY